MLYINIWENLWSQHVLGKKIQTVNYSLTEEIGTYTAIGLALVEFKFMTTSVLAGAKNKQVIEININQTKNNFVTPKQISMESWNILTEQHWSNFIRRGCHWCGIS